MNDNFFQDDVQFDRLVDGELSAIERRRLLESLDTRPEGWRRCALAFLEAQSWRQEMGQLTRERGNERPANVSTLSSDNRLMNRVLATLAIAAGLMVAFMLGGMQRQSGPAANQFASSDVKQGPAVAAPSLPPAVPDGVKTGDAVTMWVLDDGGKTRPVRVPLMEASVLDRERGVRFQPGLSSDLRSQLQQRGYEVESKQRYAPIWLEDGRQMIVPVEDTKIVPVRSVF